MAVSSPEVSTSATPSAGGSADPLLAAKLSLRLIAIFVILAVMLFGTARTFQYWEASVYLLAVWVPTCGISFTLLLRNPAVISRRLQSGERSRSQRALVRTFRPLFLLMLFVPGLDHRLGLSRTITGPVPLWLTIAGDIAIVLAILFCGWVLQVNEFAGRTIQVEAGQRVVDSGPYGLVRHPLYAASLLIWLATPLALGSWIALPLFALLTPFYVLRAINEESQLARELKGYAAYCKRTPFRLIPFVW
jgi:protein-S-isoprenylcysteine O-methyltransferase Ste14